jgi:epsilon-lactone hydrolase
VTAPLHPPPTTVSAEAQRLLSSANPPRAYPPTGDVAGWDALVAELEALLRNRLPARLPGTSTETDVDGVPVHVVRADGVPDTAPVHLELHGGSLILGRGDLTRALVTPVALATRRVTWGVDYRMPPHHPYPAAVDDALTAYRALVGRHDPATVSVGGTSAGGGIAVAMLVRARDAGLPTPAALVLDSPEVDLTEAGDTFTVLRGVDTVLHPLLAVNRLYAAGRDLADPELSPLHADLHGFPPTLLRSGTRDLFLSNTVRMHRALRAAGVDADLHVFEAMPHGGFPGAPEDAEYAAEVRRFLASQVEQHPHPDGELVVADE